MSLFGPKQFVTQPRTLGEVNQSSPYAKGLVSLGTTVNGVLRDFVNRVNFTRGAFALADVPRVSTDSRFAGVYASATSTSGAYWDLPLPSTLKFNDKNEITIFAVAYSTVTTASPRRRVIRVGTAASFLAGIDFSDVSSNSFSALVANTSSTPKVLVSSITPSANTPYAVCVVRKAADVTFYLNGQVPTQSVTPAGSTSNNSFDIDRISIDGNITGSSLTGGVLVYGIWNRGLSAQEVFALSQNPWQLFTKTQSTPLFFDIGGAGAQTVNPSLYTNNQSFYAPTITATVTVSPSLLTNNQTFYAPTATPGALTVSPSLLTNNQTFYAPTATPGAVTLQPSLVTNNQTFYAPSVGQGGAVVYPSLFTNTNIFFAAEAINEYPDPSQVEFGVKYGPGGTLVGTLTGGGGSSIIRLRSFTERH